MTEKQYKLKPNQPAFDVVDGPLAGRKYTHGQTYTEVPPGDAKKFTVIKPTATSVEAGKTAGGKRK